MLPHESLYQSMTGCVCVVMIIALRVVGVSGIGYGLQVGWRRAGGELGIGWRCTGDGLEVGCRRSGDELGAGWRRVEGGLEVG